MKLILNTCNSQKLNSTFQLLHDCLNLLLIDFKLVISLLIFLRPFRILLLFYFFLCNHQCSQACHWEVLTLLIDKSFLLPIVNKVFHYCVCSFEVQHYLIFLSILDNNSHSLCFTAEREYIQDVILDLFAWGKYNGDIRLSSRFQKNAKSLNKFHKSNLIRAWCLELFLFILIRMRFFNFRLLILTYLLFLVLVCFFLFHFLYFWFCWFILLFHLLLLIGKIILSFSTFILFLLFSFFFLFVVIDWRYIMAKSQSCDYFL